MNPRQQEFADAQTAEVERDADIIVYLAARKNGASAEYASWVVRDWRVKCEVLHR